MEPFITWDQQIFKRIIQLRDHGIYDLLFTYLTELGSYRYGAVLLMCLILWCYKKRGLKIIFLAHVIALPSTLVLILLKRLIDRPRPAAIFGEHIQIAGTEILNHFSFPSGHAFTAFCLLGLLLAFNKQWGLLFLPLACLIGFSRIYIGAHFPLDVCVGSIIGFVPNYWIAMRLKIKLKSSPDRLKFKTF